MGSSADLLINLPIAMFITSYSRIRMLEYKQMLGDNILYTDTDSIFTTVPLPVHLVGEDLGKMKLEYIADDAVFLAPKVYAVIVNGKEIVKIKGNKMP
jgi:DNA polymerase elongation subunit (family B)